MKLLCTLLCCIALAPQLWAQNRINWGPSHRDSRLFTRFTPLVLGADEQHYYLLFNSYRSRKINIQAFDFEHRQQSKIRPKLKTRRSQVMPLAFLPINGRWTSFVLQHDRGKRTNNLLMAQVEGNKMGEFKTLFSYPAPQRLILRSRGLNTDVVNQIKLSEDKRRILFMSTEGSTQRRADEELLQLVVLDENLNVLWRKTQEFPFRDDKVVLHEGVVSNQGEVYVLAQVETMERGRFFPDYDFKVYKITASDFSELKIDRDNDRIAMTYAGLDLSQDQQSLMVCGFYTDPRRLTLFEGGDSRGVFSTKINLSDQSTSLDTQRFSVDFLQTMISRRRANRGKGFHLNLKIINQVHFDNGSRCLIAEARDFYSYEQWMPNNGGDGGSNQSFTDFHTDDLVLCFFDANGKIVNLRNVDKEFFTRRNYRMPRPQENFSYSPYAVEFPEESSYLFQVQGEQLALVYNDFKNRGERRAMGLRMGGIFSDVTVFDHQGQLLRKENLFSSWENRNFVLQPRLSRASSQQLILQTRRNNRMRVGLMPKP
jgi:hypothetical protein